MIRSYEQALRLHVVPQIGGIRLSRLRRRDVQALGDRLVAAGHNSSTVRNALLPLRVICRRAVRDGDLHVNPCTMIDLPAVRGRRERIASAEQAARMIAALAPRDQALWAVAFYAGLRLGELRALRWSDIDLARGVIRVTRSMDSSGAVVTPKSAAGVRDVPIATALRSLLVAHRLAMVGDGYALSGSLTKPFSYSGAVSRARTRWSKIEELQPLARCGLHEARHTFASLMIAAGVNAKALCEYMGHSSITVTFDRYGHLMPGSPEQAAALLDAYLGETKAF